MIEFFTDEAGGYRYRIKGNNGEPMVTSEGYSSQSNARRGYWDLVDLLIDAHSTAGAMHRAEAKEHRASVIASRSQSSSKPETETDIQEAPEESQGEREAPEDPKGSRLGGDNNG